MKFKHLIASVIICAVSLSTKAQIGKGSVWLGGGIGYNSEKNDNITSIDSKTQSFNINPGIGIAVKDNTIVGVDLKYSHEKKENDPSVGAPERKTNTYGIGIFVRRYVPVINKLYIFGQGRAGYDFTKQTDKIASSTSKSESWSTGLNFTPGVSFAVNNKIHLESGFNSLFSINYGHTKSLTSKGNSFSAGVNLDNSSTFYIGIRFLINKKA
jgi:opacity protein-like surface antigen